MVFVELMIFFPLTSFNIQRGTPGKNSPLTDVKDLFSKIKSVQSTDNSIHSMPSSRQPDKNFQTWKYQKNNAVVNRNDKNQYRAAHMKKHRSESNVGAFKNERFARSYHDVNKKWSSESNVAFGRKKQLGSNDDDLSSISDIEFNGNRNPKKEVASVHSREPNFAISLLRTFSLPNLFSKRRKNSPRLQPAPSQFAMKFHDESSRRENFELQRSAAFTLQMEKSLRCLNQSNASVSEVSRRSDSRNMRYSNF